MIRKYLVTLVIIILVLLVGLKSYLYLSYDYTSEIVKGTVTKTDIGHGVFGAGDYYVVVNNNHTIQIMNGTDFELVNVGDFCEFKINFFGNSGKFSCNK